MKEHKNHFPSLADFHPVRNELGRLYCEKYRFYVPKSKIRKRDINQNAIIAGTRLVDDSGLSGWSRLGFRRQLQ